MEPNEKGLDSRGNIQRGSFVRTGIDVVADDRMGPDQRWVMVRPSAGGAALTFVTWFPTMPAGSLKGLVLEVDDVDQVAEDLMSRSMPVTGGIEEAPWGRRSIGVVMS